MKGRTPRSDAQELRGCLGANGIRTKSASCTARVETLDAPRRPMVSVRGVVMRALLEGETVVVGGVAWFIRERARAAR
jgi:hypothetical protein